MSPLPLRYRLNAKDKMVHAIMHAVCREFEMRLAQLLGNGRHQAVAIPRAIAMHIARKVTGASWPKLGDLFNRDHSTVIMASRRALALMTADPELAEAAARIEAKVAEAGA